MKKRRQRSPKTAEGWHLLPFYAAGAALFLVLVLALIIPRSVQNQPSPVAPPSTLPATSPDPTPASTIPGITGKPDLPPAQPIRRTPLPGVNPGVAGTPVMTTPPDIHPEYGNGSPKSGHRARNQVPFVGAGRLVLVIDDAGYSLSELQSFLDLPFPLTIAVLPSLPNSKEAARRVLAAGKELILHQPMQARGGQNPGPGALTAGMSREAIQSTMESNLATVPGVVGLNNHMGSLASEDPLIMSAVMELAQSRQLYYLDSLTTARSAAQDVASRIHLPLWERDVFLDNAQDRASIVGAIEEARKIASSGGCAVMIGHVWSADLAQTLMEVYPGLIERGYSLSTIATLMMEGTEADTDEDSGN